MHPRIVRLLDLFEIDAMSFATVLEVAPGGDLASHLQLHPVRAVTPAAAVAEMCMRARLQMWLRMAVACDHTVAGLVWWHGHADAG